MEKYILKGSDEITVEFDKRILEYSTTISELVDIIGLAEYYEVDRVDGNALETIRTWIHKSGTVASSPSECNSSPSPPYISTISAYPCTLLTWHRLFFLSLSLHSLISLVNGANYLGVKCLLEAATKFIGEKFLYSSTFEV